MAAATGDRGVTRTGETLSLLPLSVSLFSVWKKSVNVGKKEENLIDEGNKRVKV